MHQRRITSYVKSSVPPIVPRFKPRAGVMIGKENVHVRIVGFGKREETDSAVEHEPYKKGI